MRNFIFLITLSVYACQPAWAVEEFILDGLPEVVQLDTITPANSKGLPVNILGIDGTFLDLATETKQDDMIAELTTANTYLLSLDNKQPALVGGRIPVEVGGTVPLPTGAATEATLAALNAKFGSLGQKNMAGSAPVVLASDQSAIPVSQSGTWNINNISGTISLPTGAATLAEQQGQTTLLSAITTEVGEINTKTPTLGQKTMSGSAPVVIASDQSSISTTARSAQNTATFDQITNLTTVAQTFTAPAGAVGFKIQAPSTNTQNVVWRVNGTATATAGILMEPGRSEDFDTSSNISVIAVSGTNQVVTVQWKVRP